MISPGPVPVFAANYGGQDLESAAIRPAWPNEQKKVFDTPLASVLRGSFIAGTIGVLMWMLPAEDPYDVYPHLYD